MAARDAHALTSRMSLSHGSAGAQRLAMVLLFVTPAIWSVNYLVARWAPA